MFKHLDMWYMACIWTLAQSPQCDSRPDSKVGPVTVNLWGAEPRPKEMH